MQPLRLQGQVEGRDLRDLPTVRARLPTEVGGSPSGKERQTFIHLKGRAQPMGEEGNGLSSGEMTG